MNLPQQQTLIKAFRLLRKGASTAEVLIATKDTNPNFSSDLLSQIADIARLTKNIETAIEMSIGASAILKHVDEVARANTKKKPSVTKAKPRLRMVRGGKS